MPLQQYFQNEIPLIHRHHKSEICYVKRTDERLSIRRGESQARNTTLRKPIGRNATEE